MTRIKIVLQNLIKGFKKYNYLYLELEDIQKSKNYLLQLGSVTLLSLRILPNGSSDYEFIKVYYF